MRSARITDWKHKDLEILGVCAARGCCKPAIMSFGVCEDCVERIRGHYDYSENVGAFLSAFTNMTSWVYFAYAPLSRTIKIGVTKNVRKRMINLQTGVAGKIELLTCMRAKPEFEKRLHEIFASSRINNEWFAFTRPFVDFLVKISEQEKPNELELGSIDIDAAATRHGYWLEAKISRSEVFP